ncbi:PilZ domain-containing protein [Bradyrhizobium sp.]|uniref:PilZ domain-containing protein n=1 Tax=Bradyrhizobium sp. TaxID=376 RepID=UPI003C6FBCED
MTIDKPRTKVQREPRRDMHKKTAWITVDDGATPRECVVLDVSPGGAKIVTDDTIDGGGLLGLQLVATHPKRQPCEVVWRQGNTYGIKFLP